MRMRNIVGVLTLAYVFSGQAYGACLLECDEKGCPLPLAVPEIEWVYSATETNMTSITLPRGCLDGTARFCCVDMEFDCHTWSNRLSVAAQGVVDSKRSLGGYVQAAGLVEHKIEVSKDEKWMASATLYNESSASFAREIAMRDFFRNSTMSTDAIAACIDVRIGNVGDYSFSWKPYDVHADYVTFVRGNVAVVVQGRKDAICVAKVIDAILLECVRLGSTKPLVTITAAAEELSRRRFEKEQAEVRLRLQREDSERARRQREEALRRCQKLNK